MAMRMGRLLCQRYATADNNSGGRPARPARQVRRSMDEVPPVGREENDLFKRFIGRSDGPAYVRRARRVEDGFRALVDHCDQKRRTMLEIVRVRLGMLRALAGDWDNLSGVVMDAPDLKVLRRLEDALEPVLR